MRTYDTLFMWFMLLIVFILGYFVIPSFFLYESSVSHEYLLIGLFITLLGLVILLFYFLGLRRQRNQIHIHLKAFQEAGMQVFIEKYEKLLYSRDVGDLPKIARFIFNFNCLAVIQPKNIEELKEIISLCEKYKIPLIPRGAGTSGYGGVLPIKNGIIVIMTLFDKIIDIDEENDTVEAECGITWEHLRKFLESNGKTLKTYPSSAPSSTIGGWVTQGGWGVGSAKFGSINESMINVTIIGTEGKEFQLEDPEVFIGSCGRLGILWKVTLKIMNYSTMIHKIVSSTRQSQLLKAISEYQGLLPFFLRYDDYNNLIWKNSKPNQSLGGSQECTGGVISMSFLEEDWNQGEFNEIKDKFQLVEQSNDLGKKFWNERFNTIKLKRRGPFLIIIEILLPTIYLEKIIGVISKRYEKESYALEILPTSDHLSVMFVWFPVDMRRWSLPLIGSFTYAFHWLRFIDIIHKVRRWKGRPYSSGLWFSSYSGLIYGQQLHKMKQLKTEIDPQGIFNPGKVWGTRIPRFFPFIPLSFVFWMGSPLVGILYRILPKKLR
ncbi:MAG: FAD-binding oxidoreductase [Promethearchaeota archaeon]